MHATNSIHELRPESDAEVWMTLAHGAGLSDSRLNVFRGKQRKNVGEYFLSKAPTKGPVIVILNP